MLILGASARPPVLTAQLSQYHYDCRMPDAITESRWARGHYRPNPDGPSDAVLYYIAYGSMKTPFKIAREKYRFDGVPDGIRAEVETRESAGESFDKPLAGPIGKALEKQMGRGKAKAVRKSDTRVVIDGTVTDPPDLLYLCNTVGLIAYLFDQGAEAVCDVLTARWYDRERWRTDLFLPGQPAPFNHIALNKEADKSKEAPRGSQWLHTLGMRKFGRPDISVRGVANHYHDAVVQMCGTLIESMAFGLQVPEGYEVKMATLPPGVTCHHAGSLDDPDFNNVHLDVRLPQ